MRATVFKSLSLSLSLSLSNKRVESTKQLVLKVAINLLLEENVISLVFYKYGAKVKKNWKLTLSS